MRSLEEHLGIEEVERDAVGEDRDHFDVRETVFRLEAEMHEAAQELRFEEAARLRDRIEELKGTGPEELSPAVARGIGRRAASGGRGGQGGKGGKGGKKKRWRRG